MRGSPPSCLGPPLVVPKSLIGRRGLSERGPNLFSGLQIHPLDWVLIGWGGGAHPPLHTNLERAPQFDWIFDWVWRGVSKLPLHAEYLSPNLSPSHTTQHLFSTIHRWVITRQLWLQEPVQLDPIPCGIELNCVPDLLQTLEYAKRSEFDFVAIPLVHPRYQRDLLEPQTKQRALTRSDMLLNSSQWNTLVIGKVSTWIQLDSEIERTRKNSEKVLQLKVFNSICLGAASRTQLGNTHNSICCDHTHSFLPLC